MAIKGRAPVVPMAITGARAAMRKGSAILRPVTVSIRIGPPVEIETEDLAERDRLIERTRAAVQALLAAEPSAADEEGERPRRGRGWPSVAVMPSSSRTSSVRNGSSSASKRISSTRFRAR